MRFRYEVDPSVRLPTPRPFVPEPDLLYLRPVAGLVEQIPLADALELTTPDVGIGAEVLKEF